MTLIEQLNSTRRTAGLAPLSEAQFIELAEKKMSGAAKADFLAKMSGKSAKDADPDMSVDSKKTKKDKEVDDGQPGPSKGARKAMADADEQPSTKKKKKKVSEGVNDILSAGGVAILTAAQAQKIDQAYEDLDD